MSATTPPPPPLAAAPRMTLDVSGTPQVPFWRLCAVELRKARDTRAGFWLMFSIGVIVALLQLITLISVMVQDFTVTFSDFTGNPWLVSLALVPMLPILLVTTEWSQRTAMVSFALEPRRLRVVLAKLVVSVIVALAAMVLILVIATICTGISELFRPEVTEWSIDTDFVFFGQPATLLTTTVFGWAVAAMLLNTPAAIVLFILGWYASLLILGALTGLLPFLEDALPWITLQINALSLADELPQDAEAWGQLIVSFGLWIVLPTVLGALRIVRSEVK